MAVVAGHSQAVVLGNLLPDTQYQLTVAAVYNGRKYKSRPIVFKTMGEFTSSSSSSSLLYYMCDEQYYYMDFVFPTGIVSA